MANAGSSDSTVLAGRVAQTLTVKATFVTTHRRQLGEILEPDFNARRDLAICIGDFKGS